VHALVVSNMRPDAAHPERGSFVRDQVAALRALGGTDVELYEFPPGPRALARAALKI
jgi:teichuronic acid biosynthesis glycosyltransferase TuaC